MPDNAENTPFCPLIKEACRPTCQMFVDNGDGGKYCGVFSIDVTLAALTDKIGQIVHILECMRIEGVK